VSTQAWELPRRPTAPGPKTVRQPAPEAPRPSTHTYRLLIVKEQPCYTRPLALFPSDGFPVGEFAGAKRRDYSAKNVTVKGFVHGREDLPVPPFGGVRYLPGTRQQRVLMWKSDLLRVLAEPLNQAQLMKPCVASATPIDSNANPAGCVGPYSHPKPTDV
jgi:hypothetical protein